MGNRVTKNSRYVTEFSDKEETSFYYFTLIQENSTYDNNIFLPGNSDLEEYKADLLNHLDAFFSIYVLTFSGDEREGVHKILGRILPKSYQQEVTDKSVYFRNTCKALLEHGNVKADAGTPCEEVEELQKKLVNEIIDYNKVRESQEAIDGSENDQTIITLCLKKEKEKFVVVGGMILEYYSSRDISETPLSHCILTYLFFDKNYRGRGLGAYFIKEILPIITGNKIWIKGSDKPIKPSYVFFEADNPIYADDEEVKQANQEEAEDFRVSWVNKKESKVTDEKRAKKNLKFFGQNGARWLDICYVQPRLSPDQSRVYNLLFMILPEVSDELDNSFVIEKKDVLTFLINFYKNLEGDQEKFALRDKLSENQLLSSINQLDVDLARSYLAIEIADALDDFENNLQYDQVVKLRSLQRGLENQLDFIADLIKGKNTQDIHIVFSFLEPLFMGRNGIDKADESFREYCDKFLSDQSKLIDHDRFNTVQAIVMVIREKKKNVEKAAGIKSLPTIWEELYLILKKADDTARKKSQSSDQLSKENTFQTDEKPTPVFKNNETFYLKEVPQFEEPKFQFDKSSIAFNIALNQHVDSKYFELAAIDEEGSYTVNYENKQARCFLKGAKLLHLKKGKKILTFEELDCPIFKSYENDLLAFNYYEEKSRTKNKFLTSFTVEVTFPYKIEFLSEGRKESLFLDVRSDPFQTKIDDKEVKYFTYKKKLKGFLNVMYFKDDVPEDRTKLYETLKNRKNSTLSPEEVDVILDYEVAKAKSLVWNIVFTNDRDDQNKRMALTEYEIIALAKLFSGKQERSYVDIKFEKYQVKTRSPHIEELLTQIFSIINAKVAREMNLLYEIHSGIIQIDTLSTKIYSKKKIRESKEEIKFTDLFESDSDTKLRLDKQKKLGNKRKLLREVSVTKQNIYILLEEYLKDNVDNIALMDQLYPVEESDEEDKISYREVYRNARDFHYDDAFTGFEDRYNENIFLKYFFNALCGIALGIFDFHRMGYEEVTDTILPLKESATDKAMIIMKRASLFNCCHDNSVFESSIGTIGMSPYLIIPNSVLVYNRIHADHYIDFQANIMKLSEEDINDQTFIDLRDEAKKDLNFVSNDLYQLLLKLRRRTESYLDNIYIPNIFNYPTEQEIYLLGIKDRGIEEIYNKIKIKKEELDEKIIDLIDIRNTIFNLLITIFLGLLSFTNLYDFLDKIFADEKSNYKETINAKIPEDQLTLSHITFIFILASFILYFGSRLNKILPKYIIVDLNYFLFSKRLRKLIRLFYKNFEIPTNLLAKIFLSALFHFLPFLVLAAIIYSWSWIISILYFILETAVWLIFALHYFS